MLSRIISLHSRTQIRLIFRTFSPSNHSQIPKSPFSPFYPHHFSTYGNNNGGNGGQDGKKGSGLWKISQESDNLDDIFKFGDEVVESKKAVEGERGEKSKVNDDLDDIFGSFVEKLPSEGREPKKVGSFDVEGGWGLGDNVGSGGGGGGVFDEFLEDKSGGGEGETEPWQFGAEEDDGKVEDVFGIVDDTGFDGGEEDERSREEREMVAAAEKLKLEKEEHSLLEVIKGPDRAFGDLVAASGITDTMLDSLIALKNFQDTEGLPPLSEIEDERYLKTLNKSSRYEMELQKQEDAAKARVKKVDEKGRAYGTGKRKCSIARVWIQPGEGKFFVNDKEFDVYFPMLDHRATLLRPFSETKTLGLWDVNCTVKGGGTTGQVGAIRLGVSRALQNWEPGLRPPLKEAGFLTRDPRIVERKKPGKAKARKSFQWVKR